MNKLDYKNKILPREITHVPKALWGHLWTVLFQRLQNGEVMVSNEQFYEALADEFTIRAGGEPSEDLLLHMQKMVAEINAKYPDKYLARGVQNGLKRAFEEGIRKSNWDVAKIQAMGSNSLRRFCRQPEFAKLLEAADLHLEQIDLLDCVVGTLRELTQVTAPQANGSVAELGIDGQNRYAGTETQKTNKAVDSHIGSAQTTGNSEAAGEKPKGHAQTSPDELQAAVATGEVDQDELNQRTVQQERVHKEITRRERARMDENLDDFVEMGILDEEEADQLRALQEVEDKLKRGEINELEADRIRNSILKGEARSELERKVREAVDHAVIYLQVYQAMQRIDNKYDQALVYLIDHKALVMAQKFTADMSSLLMSELLENVPLLEDLVDLMERKDQEIRMLSVRLPPYNAIAGRGLERIGNMIIESAFVPELRAMDEDAMSRRLNSTDAAVRVRPAADIRCFMSLIDHLTKRTAFRKQIRLLRVNLAIEQLFTDTADIKQARHQAESFLERRLRRLFPDMSLDESSVIKSQGAKMIDDIEQRVIAERKLAASEKREARKAKVAIEPQTPSRARDEMELTDEERQKGVQIGRVETRVGGGMRRIPLKIMPDEDDSSLFVIVQRNPETGELAPQMRRGQKRIVEKGKDGMWRSVK